jgi:hypothetical protein
MDLTMKDIKFKMNKGTLDNLKLIQKVFMSACREYYICKARLNYFLSQNPKWLEGYELEREYEKRFGDLDQQFNKEVESHEKD